MISPEILSLALAVIVGLGLLGGIGWGVKALIDRKTIAATASSAQAAGDSIIAAAARELVDPLRRELEAERAEHSRGIDIERKKLAIVRSELDLAMDESRALRIELAEVREDMHRLQEENHAYRRRIVELDETYQRTIDALERELEAARHKITPPTT